MPRSLLTSMASTLEVHENPKLGLAAEMLRGRGTVRLELRGTSMLPSLWPGDLLTIQCVEHNQVVPGDIVLVMRDNRFFAHRLIGKQHDQDCVTLITRGDAVPQNDPPVATSEVLGRVSGVRRGSRILVPSQRVSLFHRVLAWMLCHQDHFRSVALRIHAARLQASPPRAGQFFRGVFAAVREIPGDLSSRTSQP
jgi:signal peptidase